MVDGRREQRHLGVYTPTSAPVSDQEEGLSGLLSRRPRVRVVYCVNEPKALLPFFKTNWVATNSAPIL